MLNKKNISRYDPNTWLESWFQLALIVIQFDPIWSNLIQFENSVKICENEHGMVIKKLYEHVCDSSIICEIHYLLDKKYVNVLSGGVHRSVQDMPRDGSTSLLR